jgi:putative ABC transport system permease protein
MTVVVRSSGDSEALSATVRASVAAIDPAEPLSRLFPMESLINQVTGPYSTVAIFVLVLGAVTLLLSAVGVYGVISYNFTQRTREIGIRVALGARRVDVLDLVIRQVGITMLAGLGPGLLLAGLIGGAMKAFLVGVTATDWKVYTAMCVLLAIVALLAATAPARRAMAIDPATALRTE